MKPETPPRESVTSGSSRRAFAIVPAAGDSRRMGQPKLTMPWGNSTVIEHVLDAWTLGGIDGIVVVVKGNDHELAAVCRSRPLVEVMRADPPPRDMASSIRLGLAACRARFSPTVDDAWLVSPADLPGLSPAAISRLCHHWRIQKWDTLPACQESDGAPASASRMPGLIAHLEGRRTHPVLFPWEVAERWLEAENERLTLRDWIDRRSPLPVDIDDLTSRATMADLDTPEDYRRGTALHRSNPLGDDVQS